MPRRRNLFQDVVAIIHRWEVYGTPSPAAVQTLRQAADSAGVALSTDPDDLAGFLRLEPALRTPQPIGTRGAESSRQATDPYLDPYGSCLMRLMRLLVALRERG